MTRTDAEPRQQRCENCRHSEAPLSADEPDTGGCRRYAPSLSGTLSGSGDGAFPKVRCIDWCGQWASLYGGLWARVLTHMTVD
jgi:hypothetical protein